MAACDHISCLRHVQNSNTGEIILEDTDRFSQVTRELPNPYSQTPQLVTFIGTKSKDGALKQIFPQNNIGRRGERGNINLRLETSSVTKNTPLMFIDSSPFVRDAIERSHVLCHETISYSASWKADDYAVIDILYARLLFLFSDVVCLFADDFPDLSSLLLRLITWCEIGSAMDLPEIRPRLLIIVSEDTTFGNSWYQELHNGLQTLSTNVSPIFSSIKVFQLAGSYLSPLARYQRLRSEIYLHITEVAGIRGKQNLLLSAVHFAALFAGAIQHTAKTIVNKFNFIQASRKDNEVGDDYIDHVHTFLAASKRYKTPYDSVASFLASSIIMDAYPPRMHVFSIDHVFEYLYQEKCQKALEACYNNLCARHMCGEIRRHCSYHFDRLERGFVTSSRLHWGNIRYVDKSIGLYRSNTTCLYCIRRLPEHHLSCGHCICNECIAVFGVAGAGIENRMTVKCIHNDCGELTVDLKPKTAGIRAIGIDGGGSRGITSLELLKELQKLLEPCPLHELVDIACGSSSGGLIALAKFHMQWSVEQCGDLFESFASRCFSKTNSVLGMIRSALNYVVKDAIYDERVLETLIKDTFGLHAIFFDHLPAVIPGTRVAVTAMTHGSLPSVFTNYNGTSHIQREAIDPAPRFQDTGYVAIRPKELDKEPLLWEVARATSAAPIFFKPIAMDTGDFWDGALGFPNPTKLARWEANRLWPGAITDVAISLGTGEEPKPPTSGNSRSRLLHSFNLFLDGEFHFLNLKAGVKADKELLRLNTKLSHPIRLDDTSSLQAQKHFVHSQPESYQSLTEAAIILLVSAFYFQLDAPIKYDSGVYYCEGSIHCRGDYTKIASALAELVSPKIRFATQTETLIDCHLGQEGLCKVCRRFRKDITFMVRHPENNITISVCAESGATWKISGFPQSLSGFEKQQGLSNHFGKPNHDVPGEIRYHPLAS
ncbi:patatin-like phospholipase family protein [Aspergillus undulatus]|uniref:patatin-like phospholipase family protein n=1 Tax=Aspergillus undulatus TaxID=1810928 RepID=UPI003CCD3468